MRFTDIFNHNNQHGCFDNLQIEKTKFKREVSKFDKQSVKNHYENFIKPVGCVSSLNVQNIYNNIMKDHLYARKVKKYCGAMFAGKTSELLKEFCGQNIRIKKILLNLY